MLRESKIGQSYLRWVGEIPLSLVQRLSLKPNHLTFMTLFISLGTVPAFLHSLWLGGIGVLLSGVLDTLDGSLARKLKQQTRAGAFLDSVFDRYSDFLMVLGIWLFFQAHPVPAQVLITPLLFLLLAGSFMVSYSRARGEGLGLSISLGLFERAERIIALGAGAILNDLLTGMFPSQDWLRDHLFFIGLLTILSIGTHLTAFQRIVHLFKHL